MSTYNPQHWADNPEGGTPIQANRLLHIESGLANALLYTDEPEVGDIPRMSEVGWELVPGDAYITASSLLVQGVVDSFEQLPQVGQPSEAWIVMVGDTPYTYVWAVEDEKWVNIGDIGMAQGPPGPQGERGPVGAGLSILGTLEDVAERDGLDPGTLTAGDGYMIDGELHVWDGTEWSNTGNVGVFSHSTLNDLEADDHPQYALIHGARNLTIGSVTPADPLVNDIWFDNNVPTTVRRWNGSEWRAVGAPQNTTTFIQDTLASRPDAGPAYQGSFFWATDIESLSYCDGYVWIEEFQPKYAKLDSEPEFTGNLKTPNAVLGVQAIGTSGGVTNLNFDWPAYLVHDISNHTTYTTSNLGAGKTLTIKVAATTNLKLTFPPEWTFLGLKPTSIQSGKTGVLTVTSFGDTNADCVATWGTQL